MRVTLGLGIGYTPAWVFSLPNSRYVAQDGSTASHINLVFNQRIRERVAAYVRRIDADLGLENFWAIRLTSGGSGEVLYPDGGKYWAFDANAQNGADLPPSMARNPFPGWKPGNRALSTSQVRQWADWYVGALADTVDWQMELMTGLGFGGYFEVLTPGSGARPSTYTDDINNYLPPSVTGVGAVWHKLYGSLRNRRHVVAYVSSMADRSGNDDGCQGSDRDVPLTSTAANSWSATRWLSRIADEYGLAKNGENPGWDAPSTLNPHYTDASPSGMMAAALRQMTTCGLLGMYWAHSEKLWDGTIPASRYFDSMRAANAGEFPLPAPAP
jgi:hypothetical protein